MADQKPFLNLQHFRDSICASAISETLLAGVGATKSNDPYPIAVYTRHKLHSFDDLLALSKLP